MTESSTTQAKDTTIKPRCGLSGCDCDYTITQLLEALEKILFEVDGAYNDKPAALANVRFIEGQARAAIGAAKGPL